MLRYKKEKKEIVKTMSIIFKGTFCICVSLVVKLFQILKILNPAQETEVRT